MPIKKEGMHRSRVLLLPESVCGTLAEDGFTSNLHPIGLGCFLSSVHIHEAGDTGASECILLICTKGDIECVWAHCGHHLPASAFVVIPPDTAYEFFSSQGVPCTIYQVRFSGRLAESYASHFSQVCCPSRESGGRLHECIDLFEEIFSVLSGGFGITSLRYASSAFAYLMATLRFLSDERNERRPAGGSGLISRCRYHVMDNIEDKISLDDICRICALSKTQCIALFRREVGYTPMQYVNYLRVQKALEMMKETGLPVSQVCYKVGIEDPYYFSRLVRKFTGHPPSYFKDGHK